MSAIHQEVAPERWPEWYAERRIDPIESGRRLEAFLRMRRAAYPKAVQFYRRNRKGDALSGRDWFGAFKHDWACITGTSAASAKVH